MYVKHSRELNKAGTVLVRICIMVMLNATVPGKGVQISCANAKTYNMAQQHSVWCGGAMGVQHTHSPSLNATT